MQALANAQALLSFVRIVRDPNRLDEVFELSDKLAGAHPEELAAMVDALGRTEKGAKALRERPRLGKLSLSALGEYPEGTLARGFADFLGERGLDPASIPTLEVHDEGSFVRAHLYETHDLWHVVTGFDTDVAGELGLQAFYAAQVPGKLPIALLSGGMLNTLIYADGDRARRLAAISRGWTMGERAAPFFGTDWAQLWSTPLAEVRSALRLSESEVSPARLAS